MAFIKEVILAALFTAFALAQLPNVEVPAVPALPDTPVGNNTQLPNTNGTVPATPAVEVPNTNGTVPATPEVPNTNGTGIDTGMATPPAVPGQESTTAAPNRLMNAINGIRGNRG